MAATVDFYISSEQGVQARLILACRLVEKAYNLGHRVYVHVASERAAQEIDDLLWTFKQNSFVPHAQLPVQSEASAPVLIGWRERPPDCSDVLLNLADEAPTFFSEFSRVVETVSQDEMVLSQSRMRFRFYREHDAEPTVHKL